MQTVRGMFRLLVLVGLVSGIAGSTAPAQGQTAFSTLYLAGHVTLLQRGRLPQEIQLFGVGRPAPSAAPGPWLPFVFALAGGSRERPLTLNLTLTLKLPLLFLEWRLPRAQAPMTAIVLVSDPTAVVLEGQCRVQHPPSPLVQLRIACFEEPVRLVTPGGRVLGALQGLVLEAR